MKTSRSSSLGGALPPALEPALERRLLASVPSFLDLGLALYDWWKSASARNEFQDRFEEISVFNRPDTSFGFFDHAQIGNQTMPVMGNFQTVDYDRPKSPRAAQNVAADWMRVQVREFVLRYFMRVSDFREPEAYTPPRIRPVAPPLDWLSLCPKRDPGEEGFGFSQLYYKLRGSEGVGRFPESERTAIVDLRNLGSVYDWIVLWVRIFDFQFRVSPFGSDLPGLMLPLRTASYLVMNPEFVILDDHPSSPDELGRYGLGYAFIKNPDLTVFGYGPGEFTAAFESIQFIVFKDGRVRVTLAFVSNVPERILNLSIDPFSWTAKAWDAGCRVVGLGPLAIAGDLSLLSPFRWLKIDPVFGFTRAANFLTDGRAATDFCISERQILKEFLLKHFQQHYHTITGSLRTWRQIPDWTDAAALPDWVVSGRSG